MAKALGNGIPIGATMVVEWVAEKIIIDDHGTTFGGYLPASRVGHYVFECLSKPELLKEVGRKGEVFKIYLKNLQNEFPELITEIRGRGLILGMQMTRGPTELVKMVRERGLLVITAGKDTLRFVPPLVIEDEVIKQEMKILEEALAEFHR